MEASDSPLPDVATEQAPTPMSPPLDDKRKATHIRMLVSNMAAGCIIGKGGVQINEFQNESGARIQLSRNHEFFPGTTDRIIMISGSLDEIMKAAEMILEKLQNEAAQNNESEVMSKVRLVVPNGSCGGIIGKGGSNIKSFVEESGAGIKISPQDNNFAGFHDRLVVVSGSLDKQMHAISLILSKLLEDDHYPSSLSSPFPYIGNFPGHNPGAPVGYVIPANYNNYGPNGHGGRYPNSKANMPHASSMRPPVGSGEVPENSVMIPVADEHIGAVVGRAGRNISEITHTSGARIKISDRGDFMPGTKDRKITISGTQDAIRIAQALIMEKVSSSADR